MIKRVSVLAGILFFVSLHQLIGTKRERGKQRKCGARQIKHLEYLVLKGLFFLLGAKDEVAG